VIGDILESLTAALSGTPAIAILASLAWGMLSVVLSPCHLAGIPLIIGFIGGQGVMSVRRAFSLALAFALGVLATIALIGVVTAALGRMLGDLGTNLDYFLAGLLVLVGLYFLGIIPMPSGAARAGTGGLRGLPAALVLGLVFGLVLGPCTFAFMAPVLGMTLSVARTEPAYGALLLAAYGVGHSAVIVAAGTFTEAVERYLKWSERSGGPMMLKRICGILVIAAAIYLLWSR
jgi:cytochrome c-type biogenesis protein